MSDAIRSYTDGKSTNVGGVTVNTPYEDANKSITTDDFLQLMIAQMKNIDFMGEGGGADSSQFVTQLAQISSMQEMQQLAYYSKTNYVMSMVGKEVTVATLGLGGKVDKTTGVVEKISMSNNEFLVYVDGKGYKLSEVMTVNNPNSVTDDALKDISKSAVVIMDFSDTTATVRWDKPTSDEATLEKLTYSVYYSKSPDMNTPEEVRKNGTLSGDAKQKDMYEAEIEELEPNTTYYVNVIATTSDGKEYVYQKSTVRTEK